MVILTGYAQFIGKFRQEVSASIRPARPSRSGVCIVERNAPEQAVG